MADFNNIKVEPHLTLNVGIGKKNTTRVAIWNKGEDNQFHDITTENMDISILDEGKRSIIKNLKAK